MLDSGKHNLKKEKEKKNRSEKLGNTQIVVIQFTAGRTQLFQQAAVITSAPSKQAFTRLQTRLTVTTHIAFIIFFVSPFAREKIILFYF